jgi:phosphatidylinositol alpha-mannosyltransferase
MEVRVAVSEDAREMADEALGGSYEVAFNGIEVAKFQEIEAVESPQPTIAYVGRHEPRKGLETLLQALRNLPEAVKLWVMSEGPQTGELKARYGGDPRIEWLGSVTDEEKISRLKGADVFCVPSLRGESFGIVLLEGMAAGTPIVASNIAGYKNVATHEKHAELVEPGNPELLAAALTRVLEDKKYSASLILAGHERAAEFSMDRLAQLYLRYYKVAIDQSNKATKEPSRWSELAKFRSFSK